MLNAGDPSPGFYLHDSEGNLRSLDVYLTGHRAVLLVFLRHLG